jgi:hypothetical protein
MQMLNLKNVTLVILDCVNPLHAVNSLQYSSQKINFAGKVLISHERPRQLPTDIDFYYIDKITT